MTTLIEKPPVYGSSPGNSPATRRRKVNRVSPVPKRRQSSPGRIFKVKPTQPELSDLSSGDETPADNEENDINENTAETLTSCLDSTQDNQNAGKMERPSSLTVTTSKYETSYTEETYEEERKTTYLSKRRNTERYSSKVNSSLSPTKACTCRTHRGALGSCGCSNSKRRHTVTPGVSKKEVMEKEAKLLVLEYLSSLPPTRLTARHRGSPEDEIDDSEKSPKEEQKTTKVEEEVTKNPRQGSKKGLKSNTVTIGEYERSLLMKQLAEHAKLEQKKSGKLARSTSDLSMGNHTMMRNKFKEMKVPIQKWMKSNLNRDIVKFDKNSLSTSPRRSPRRSPRTPRSPRAKQSPLSLIIPENTFNQLTRNDSVMFTPETFAVNRLEEISSDIMEHYPELLNEAIDGILSPLHSHQSITYDLFQKIAKNVYDTKISSVSSTVWSRVALVLYMVKETMFTGNLNDKQLELLVEHSAKFMTENVNETVNKEGGWDAIELDDWMFVSNVLARDDISSSDGEFNEITSSRRSSHIEGSNRDCTGRVHQTISEWSPYGMAALAVGLGLAYSYLKT